MRCELPLYVGQRRAGEGRRGRGGENERERAGKNQKSGEAVMRESLPRSGARANVAPGTLRAAGTSNRGHV